MSTTSQLGATASPFKTTTTGHIPLSTKELDEREGGDPDTLLQCPFDKNHQIRACRFPYHLIKCRKNHPKLAGELKTCPFNARHLLPMQEMTHHLATCADRTSVGWDAPKTAEEHRKWQIPVSTWNNPHHNDEDWDRDADEFAVPFVWGTSSTQLLLPTSTDDNPSSGLRTPKTLPWPVNWS